jgi:hypothetical protein
MTVLSQEAGWLSSTARATQRKVSDAARCSISSIGSIGNWVHPDGVEAGSQVGDVPDEPRQWCAFEYADLMEQGLSGGIASSFLEVPEKEMRLCVERSPDRKQFLLTSSNGANLLIARANDNSESFSIFVTGDGEPPRALGPAFTLVPSKSKDRWNLHATVCDKCESRGKRICGSREIASIVHYREEVGQGQICCMDLEIPALSEEGIADVWCPLCNGHGADQQCLELTTRKPTWNARRKSLSLDFFGRCHLASAKNFQLELVGKPEKVKLLFGKVGPNQFVLDYNRPLSMVQAFAAAVSTTVWK